MVDGLGIEFVYLGCGFMKVCKKLMSTETNGRRLWKPCAPVGGNGVNGQVKSCKTLVQYLSTIHFSIAIFSWLYKNYSKQTWNTKMYLIVNGRFNGQTCTGADTDQYTKPILIFKYMYCVKLNCIFYEIPIAVLKFN